MNQFDPFSRHRTESQPVQPGHETAEANAVDHPKPSTATPTGNPFGRHEGEKKSSIERRLRRALKVQPAQALLDWLIADQTRTTISARDICNRGPSSIRNRECALGAAKILVEHGWLTPLESYRYDRHQWQIVRKPILCPTVAAP
jgi:hypothetical protein